MQIHGKTLRAGIAAIGLALLISGALASGCFAENRPAVAWSKTYNGGGDDQANGVAVDHVGNVYVAGDSYIGSNYDYILIKYDSIGNIVWQKTYNGAYSGHAYGVAADDTGNVYVTGRLSNAANDDYFTIKYNSNGDTVWQKSYDRGINDYGYGAAVDKNGNVYVTGQSSGSWLTIKYDTNGNSQWVKTYSGLNEGCGRGITTDETGNVYVAGYINTSSNKVFVAIKYDSSGNTIWSNIQGGVNNEGYGIAVDDAGNVYVTGRTYENTTCDYQTIKYNPAGIVQWVKFYDSGYTDQAFGITVDNTGNAYVTGCSNSNYMTIKYDPSGDTIWQKTYNGGNDDSARGIALDDTGNICVTGNSYSSNYNYLTIKYIPDFSTFVLVSAKTRSETTVEVYFSSNVDSTTVQVSDFAVSGNTITNVLCAQNTVTLALQVFIAGDATPQISIVNDVQGTNESILNTGSLIASDGIVPRLLNAVAISETQVVATFNEKLYSFDTSSISVGAYTISGMAGTADTYVITLASTMPTNATPLVGIVGSNITDSSSNAAQIGSGVVASDSIPPKIISVDVKSRSCVVVLFSEIMSATADETAGYYQTGATGAAASDTPENAIIYMAADRRLLRYPYTTFMETDPVQISVLPTVKDLRGNAVLAGTVAEDSPAGGEGGDDFIPPSISSVRVISSNQVQVVFSEAVLNNIFLDFPIDTNAIQVDTFSNLSITTASSFVETVTVTIDGIISTGTMHIVTIAGQIFDGMPNFNKVNIGDTMALPAWLNGNIEIMQVDCTAGLVPRGDTTSHTVAVKISNATNCSTVTIDTSVAKTYLNFFSGTSNITNEYTVTQPVPITLAQSQSGWCTFTITKIGTTSGSIQMKVNITGIDDNGTETTDDTNSFWIQVYVAAGETIVHAHKDVFGNTLTVVLIPADSLDSPALIIVNDYASDTNETLAQTANNTARSDKTFGYSQELETTIRELKALLSTDTSVEVTFQNTSAITLTIYYANANINEAVFENSLRIYTLTGNKWVLVPGTQIINTTNKSVTVTINHFSVYRILGTTQAAADLSNVIVYPNPFKGGVSKITFKNITAQATIKIYNIAGELVATLEEDNGDGKYEWDVTNDNSEKVVSGVYIYVITNDRGDTAKAGKIAVIR